jgi:poly(beta-D-mannuronate) lyase
MKVSSMRSSQIAFALLVSFSACKTHGAPLRNLSAVPPPQRYERLRGPYRIEPSALGEPARTAPERAPALVAPALVVPPFPPPLRDVMGVDYYTDVRHSEIDPVLKARNEAVEAPMREFGRALMLLSDGYLRSRGADTSLASRTLEGLFVWASADALLGQVNRGGLGQVNWALGAYALDYLKVRDARGLDSNKRERVEHWFRQLAAEQMSYAALHPDWPDHANNHAYWAGMSVAVAGVAASDRTLFDWGIGRFELFLRQVQPDGTLPLELARGKRALHYHLFALAPLVMLAELGEVNGVHLYSAGNRALERLVNRCLAGLTDRAAFGALAGTPQVIPDNSDLAWLEIYNTRFHPQNAVPFLKARPLLFGFLGGDLTLAFE